VGADVEAVGGVVDVEVEGVVAVEADVGRLDCNCLCQL